MNREIPQDTINGDDASCAKRVPMRRLEDAIVKVLFYNNEFTSADSARTYGICPLTELINESVYVFLRSLMTASGMWSNKGFLLKITDVLLYRDNKVNFESRCIRPKWNSAYSVNDRSDFDLHVSASSAY